MEIRLDTTSLQDLYGQACRAMAEWLPGWQDTYASDPAVAVLEHLTWLSDIQNGLLDQVTEAHYRAYLNLLGAAPRRCLPARLTARGSGAWAPGQRFFLGELPFEVIGCAGDSVTLAQQHTRSAMTELTPPFRLPAGWAGRRVLYCFAPAQDGWRRLDTVRVENGCLAGWQDLPPDRVRVVAAEPDFPALYPLQGVAMEEVELEAPGLWEPSLRLMIEQCGLWQDCSVNPPAANRTLPVGCRWDGARRRLRFGDGRDFEVPEPGQLLVCGCICTRGTAGNGACGTLTAENGETLQSLAAAAGGVDDEPARAAFLRVVQEQRQPLRAVTCEDYEQLARQLPDLPLARVRALPRSALKETGPGVVVLAVPGSRRKNPVLTPSQQQRLAAWLEPFRLLGVPLQVRSPRYAPLAVEVTVMAGEDLDSVSLYEVARDLTDGVEGKLDFGAQISYTALYAALGRVPGVQSVRSLRLEALGQGMHRTADGGLQAAPDVLPRLTEWELHTS